MKLYALFVPIDGKYYFHNRTEQWLTPKEVQDHEKAGYIVMEI